MYKMRFIFVTIANWHFLLHMQYPNQQQLVVQKLLKQRQKQKTIRGLSMHRKDILLSLFPNPLSLWLLTQSTYSNLYQNKVQLLHLRSYW